jgi:hypothetical protein
MGQELFDLHQLVDYVGARYERTLESTYQPIRTYYGDDGGAVRIKNPGGSTGLSYNDPVGELVCSATAEKMRSACGHAAREVRSARDALNRALGILERAVRPLNAGSHDGGYDAVETQYVSKAELAEAHEYQDRRRAS